MIHHTDCRHGAKLLSEHIAGAKLCRPHEERTLSTWRLIKHIIGSVLHCKRFVFQGGPIASSFDASAIGLVEGRWLINLVISGYEPFYGTPGHSTSSRDSTSRLVFIT